MLPRHRLHKRRNREARKAWLAQAEAYAGRDTASDPALGRDGTAGDFSAKVAGDDPRYKTMVAEPVMAAVDAMPPEWWPVVWAHGYVDVYRAWRRRWPIERVRRMAEQRGGLFVL
jgi:hypothetical protein